MPKLKLVGRVLPAVLIVNLPNIPPANVQADNGLDVDFTIQIQNSEVVIECDSNKELTNEVRQAIFTLVNRFAHLVVDLLSFHTGTGHRIWLEMMIDEDGKERKIKHGQEWLAPYATALKGKDSKLALSIFLKEPAAIAALRDLTDVIVVPGSARINCARAVETLRHLLAPDLEPKKGWAVVREKLLLSEEYLKLITERSIGPRHGDHSGESIDLERDVMARAWMIMDRFLELRVRGIEALPENEFMVL